MIRVGLVADLVEEDWPSMNLVADMLSAHMPPLISAVSSGRPFHVELLRPAMRKRISPYFGKSRCRAYHHAWSLDRLTNRFIDYPRFLRSQTQAFDLFHLLDHSYSQLLHQLPPGRTVVTCHDLDTFRCLWEPDHEGRSVLFRAMTRRILSGLQKAAHVCCDSDAIRKELLERRLMPAGRVSVVRLGLRPAFNGPVEHSASQKVATMLNRGSGANGTVDLLHVGSTIARKRVDVLLDVFARVKASIEPRARLVRVGGAFTAAQSSQIQQLGLEPDSICVLPFLSPADLAAVYQQAAILLLPSEAEGFGLPVIEALACGTPVLASDLPVLREVGGNVCSYAPLADIQAWTLNVRDLLKERRESPATWNARQHRARCQGRQFTWTETARQMEAIYRRTLAA